MADKIGDMWRTSAKILANMTKPTMREKGFAVKTDNASGFLSPVLERV